MGFCWKMKFELHLLRNNKCLLTLSLSWCCRPLFHLLLSRIRWIIRQNGLNGPVSWRRQTLGESLFLKSVDRPLGKLSRLLLAVILQWRPNLSNRGSLRSFVARGVVHPRKIVILVNSTVQPLTVTDKRRRKVSANTVLTLKNELLDVILCHWHRWVVVTAAGWYTNWWHRNGWTQHRNGRTYCTIHVSVEEIC